jgi:RNA polymerase sigma factor (TIGR02999 family)
MNPEQQDSTQATQLLRRWRGGDEQAFQLLVPLVEGELRRLARHYLRGERQGHTLQTNALVNEAYLRLMGQAAPDWQGRSHFIAIAARSMRQVLVDHARARKADKRGAGEQPAPLDESHDAPEQNGMSLEEVLTVNDALQRLEELDERQARVVELRIFGGLDNREIAEALDISVATVKREWTAARAWLYGELGHRGSPAGGAP